jgi:hypothetical protein
MPEPDNADTASIREMLEREKLTLEIEQLKQPWWRKPPYILAALPTLLAIVSLIYAFANGYFQEVAIKLENQRHDLEREIKVFTKEKEELMAQIKAFDQQKEDLTRFIEQQQHSKKELLEEIQILKRSLLESRANLEALGIKNLEALEKENQRLKKENQRLKDRP